MTRRRGTPQPTKEEFRQQVVAHCSACHAALRRSDWGWVVMVSKEALCADCYRARFERPLTHGDSK